MDKNTALQIIKQVTRQEAAFDNESDFSEAVQLMCDDYFENHKGTEMIGVRGSPDWQDFEMRIWELGESIRQLLKKKKKWLKSKNLLGVILMICKKEEYGKGRQSFVLLLGEFDKSETSEVLGNLLDDREVKGHAIKALTKSKNDKYLDKVCGIAKTETGWIKSAANSYCKKFGKPLN